MNEYIEFCESESVWYLKINKTLSKVWANAAKNLKKYGNYKL